MKTPNKATWHTELGIFAGIKPILVLEGNVLDSYRYPGSESLEEGAIVSLEQYLHYFFKDKGYGNIVFYDSLRGFRNEYEEGHLAAFSDVTGLPIVGDHIPACFKGVEADGAAVALRTALTQNEVPTAIVMNYASRYIVTPESMTQAEVDSFNALQQTGLAGAEARSADGTRQLKNLLLLVVSKANDVPAWFYLKNPGVKTLTVTTPTQAEREAFIKSPNFRAFFTKEIYEREMPYFDEHPEELEKLRARFVAITEGFCFSELNMLLRLSKQEGFHIRELCDVVDFYRYGVRENPWNSIDRERVRNGHTLLAERVKGQSVAADKVLGIIKRSISGLAAASHRPRGVLFFAGPTGTGKTETAKAMAELIFGSEASIIRFDMSEYKQPHSDQKLLGAPPGYVGFEAGGQLTNAVKKKPFSILLFDEIEKADGTILDKFLQILDDGRLTDGRGDTVYFSETVIIFTSNLGIVEEDEKGVRHPVVTAKDPFEVVESGVKTAVENYFKYGLGRPELFNRIGAGNVVVFDFIRPPVDEEILRMMVDRVVKDYKTTKNITVTLEAEAFDTLLAAARRDSESGGRGIRNLVTERLETPLATLCFDEDIEENATVILHGIGGGAVATLDATVEKEG